MESKISLDVRGMHCAGCVSSVEKALHAVAGVREARVNLATGEARVQGEDVSRDALVQAVESVGFEGNIRADRSEGERAQRLEDEQRQYTRQWRIRFFVSLGLAILFLTIAMAIPHSSLTMPVLLALATAVQFYVGMPFYVSAWRRLRKGQADMDVLVALGTTTAYGAGLVGSFLSPHGHGYFHDSVMVLTFISLGKWLESMAKTSAGDAIRQLLKRTPDTAERVTPNGLERVPVDQLHVDDVILTKPGDTFAADGVVVVGESHVDESLVTGESMPVRRTVGDPVIGGTVNQDSLLQVRLTRVGIDTVLSNIARLVEQAQASKANVSRLADRVAGIFVPVILVLAAMTFVGHVSLAGWERGLALAIESAVAVLVVACPCAMGLATPTAILVATGRAAESGLLFRQAQALEEGGKLTDLVFDKTGTLTEGQPSVVAIHPAGPRSHDDLLRLGASAELSSSHPLGQAMVRAAQSKSLALRTPEISKTTPGGGLVAEVDGQNVLVGNGAFLESIGIKVPGEADRAGEGTHVFLGVDGEFAGTIELADAVKSSSAQAVRELKSIGVRPHLLTGDAPGPARLVASQVGIASENVVARVKPAEKASFLASLQSHGGKVGMVGDGINDAAALASSDWGVALADGADIARESCDIIILGDDLRRVVRAILLCRRTFAIIKQNLWWAFGYNVALVPLAMLGKVPVILAGLAMAFSSVCVVVNSLRLRKVSIEPPKDGSSNAGDPPLADSRLADERESGAHA